MYLEELIPDINIEIRGYRMKKTKFILLTIISLLALSSCEIKITVYPADLENVAAH